MEIELTATEIREDIEAFEDRLQEAKEGLDSLPVTAATSGHGRRFVNDMLRNYETSVESKLLSLYISLGELRESSKMNFEERVRKPHPPRDELNPFDRVLGKKSGGDKI